jgi:hypothetical protein
MATAALAPPEIEYPLSDVEPMAETVLERGKGPDAVIDVTWKSTAESGRLGRPARPGEILPTA